MPAFITPKTVQESNDVSLLAPREAAEQSGKVVGVIGKLPGTDYQPLLHLFAYIPNDNGCRVISCEDQDGAWASLSALAVDVFPGCIIRHAWKYQDAKNAA